MAQVSRARAYEPYFGFGATDAPPDRELLNQCIPDPTVGGDGRSLRFVAADAHTLGYEQTIFQTGHVPTRSDDWHDACNALIWLSFPHAKRAVVECHIEDMTSGSALRNRSPRRDALTQFDECGAVVASDDPFILRALADHHWMEALWQRRRAWLEGRVRLFLFGHATHDALRAPFRGLCVKTLHWHVSAEFLRAPYLLQRRGVDRFMVDRLTQLTSPKAFYPLPILGVPGMTADNACEDYYRDTRQFRPRRDQALCNN